MPSNKKEEMRMADEKAKIVTDATGPGSGPAPAQLWMYRKNDIKEVKWEIPKKDEKPRIYKENRENEQRKLSFYVDGKKVY